MAQSIYPGDLVFPVDSSGAFSQASSTVSPSVSMATSFASRAKPITDYVGWSIIAQIDASSSPAGTLSIWVTNASFTTKGDGSIAFNGPVVWLQEDQSIIQVGGQGIAPPFRMSVPFNTSNAMQVRYQAQSGSGILTAKIGGVGV